jgi:hypothetical protein
MGVAIAPARPLLAPPLNTTGRIQGSDVCIRLTCKQARGSVYLDGAARREGGDTRSKPI